MTPPEFRNSLTEIGWTYRVLASRLGIPESKAKFWAVRKGGLAVAVFCPPNRCLQLTIA